MTRLVSLIALLVAVPCVSRAQERDRLFDPARKRERLLDFPRERDVSLESLVVAAASDRGLPYDDSVLLRAGQDTESFIGGVQSGGAHGHGSDFARFDINHDFPWKVGAGAWSVPSTRASRNFWLVLPESGEPVAVSSENGVNYGHRMRWKFPAGTHQVEVLKVRNDDGDAFPFQVNLRTKAAAPSVWRPITSRAQLVSRLRELGRDDLADTVGETAVPQSVTVSDTLHPRRSAFDETFLLDVLPDLPCGVVAELLATTPFREVGADPWQPFVPEGHGFSIVPEGFIGPVAATTASCNRCHQDAGARAERFDLFNVANPSLDLVRRNSGVTGRHWYTDVSGDDGDLTWNPLNRVGNGRFGIAPEVRQSLVDHGFVRVSAQ